MDTWERLSAWDDGDLRALSDSVVAVLETVAAFFETLAAALDALSLLMIDATDPTSALLGQIVSALESAILDMMHNNLNLCVHHNLTWDDSWDFKRDYWEAGKSQSPWAGTGLQGFLDDVDKSAHTASDPFRPITDADTEVGGLVILVGATSDGEMTNIKALWDLFMDTSDIRDVFSTMDTLSRQPANNGLSKLGSAIVDEFMTSAVYIKEGWAGIAEEVTTPPWVHGTPYWMSVPVASLFPVVESALNELLRLVGLLRPAAGAAALLSHLADLLAQKAEQLAAMANELAGIVESLESLIAFFTADGVYFLWLDAETGGFAAFIDRVRDATPVMDGDVVVGPDFGAQGIVAGAFAVSTADDPMNHLQALMQLIGGYDPLSEASKRAQNLSDTYEDLF